MFFIIFLLFQISFVKLEKELPKCQTGFFRKPDSTCEDCSYLCTSVDFPQDCIEPCKNYTNNTEADYSRSTKSIIEISTIVQNNVNNTDTDSRKTYIILGVIGMIVIGVICVLGFKIYKKKFIHSSSRSPDKSNGLESRKENQSKSCDSQLNDNSVNHNNDDPDSLSTIPGQSRSTDNRPNEFESNIDSKLLIHTDPTNNNNNNGNSASKKNNSENFEMKEITNEANSSNDILRKNIIHSSSRSPDKSNGLESRKEDQSKSCDSQLNDNSVNHINDDPVSIFTIPENESSDMSCGQLTQTIHYVKI